MKKKRFFLQASDGSLHIFLKDLLEHFQLEVTKENLELARQLVAETVKERTRNVPVIYRPSEDDRRRDVELGPDGQPVPTTN